MPVVVLISGSGSNLQALLDAQLAGELPIKITAVISNRADAYGLERARRAGVPTQVLSHKEFSSRECYDRALADLIERSEPRLVVLAGFMRILSAEFVERYQGRLINIHPSLLPAFRGLDTHRRALETGATEHGCSVHFVTPELDAGPVIVQARVPVLPDDDPQTLAARVLAREHRAYPLAVRWIAEGRVVLRGDQVFRDGRAQTRPPLLLEDDRIE